MRAQVGAVVQEDISEASVVFGVKQVPVDSLQSNKTFCFFSHTIKVRSRSIRAKFGLEPLSTQMPHLRSVSLPLGSE